jgi:hypothetical protein
MRTSPVKSGRLSLHLSDSGVLYLEGPTGAVCSDLSHQIQQWCTNNPVQTPNIAGNCSATSPAPSNTVEAPVRKVFSQAMRHLSTLSFPAVAVAVSGTGDRTFVLSYSPNRTSVSTVHLPPMAELLVLKDGNRNFQTRYTSFFVLADSLDLSLVHDVADYGFFFRGRNRSFPHHRIRYPYTSRSASTGAAGWPRLLQLPI